KKERGKEGKEKGKNEEKKGIHENQMDNGSNLEQATEYIRNLKIIPNGELEKIVAMYNSPKN
ncbi:hypothetical protein CBF85_01275, partial [Lactobacillus taiwanensis]